MRLMTRHLPPLPVMMTVWIDAPWNRLATTS
jgi:hypothetical protein